VTIPVGLGIGRLVFRAMNIAETVLAAVAVTVGVSGPPRSLAVLTGVLVALLVVQLGAVRPRLNRRSDRVLAGEDLPRWRGHLHHVALEAVKVVLLIARGVGLSAH
jgi:hypothetical protein